MSSAGIFELVGEGDGHGVGGVGGRALIGSERAGHTPVPIGVGERGDDRVAASVGGERQLDARDHLGLVVVIVRVAVLVFLGFVLPFGVVVLLAFAVPVGVLFVITARARTRTQGNRQSTKARVFRGRRHRFSDP